MEQNTEQRSLLNELLAHPDTQDQSVHNYLRQLVKDYPQSGLLQALYACSGNREGLKKAAVYINSLALYKIAHAPFSLPAVNESQLLNYTAPVPAAAIVPEVEMPAEITGTPFVAELPAEEASIESAKPQAEPQVPADEEKTLIINAEPEAEQIDDVADTELLSDEASHPVIEEIQAEPTAESDSTATQEVAVEHTSPAYDAVPEQEIAGNETFEEAQAENSEYNTHVSELAADENSETTPPIEAASTTSFAAAISTDVDDEVYEEIVGIEDINFSLINRPVAAGTTADELIAAENEFSAEQLQTTQQTTNSELGSADSFATTATPTEVQATDAEPQAEPELIEFSPAEELQGELPAESIPDGEEVTETDNAPEQQPETEPVPTVEEQEEAFGGTEEAELNEQAAQPASFTEKLIIENIAATDYFIFDQAFRERNRPETADTIKEDAVPEPVAEDPAAAAVNEQQNDAEETHDVSKYHDEKMPYSFMWWLDKTRREHASIYQPYVKPHSVPPVDEQPSALTTPTTASADLQHQYIESILHSTPVKGFEPEVANNLEFDVRSKEHKIIERFIQEEPHIKPPSSDKLGSENKAKKSAEDSDELITETLARIYTDQMLYAKAIATYKKLKLKYPEKSSYFAGQIAALEKKIN